MNDENTYYIGTPVIDIQVDKSRSPEILCTCLIRTLLITVPVDDVVIPGAVHIVSGRPANAAHFDNRSIVTNQKSKL